MNELISALKFLELLNYVSVTGKNASKNMLMYSFSDLTSKS